MGHDCRSEFIDRGPVTVALRVAVHYPDASKVRDRDRSVRPAVAKIRVARIFARIWGRLELTACPGCMDP